jgi:3-dehydroshikimate dehydratase
MTNINTPGEASPNGIRLLLCTIAFRDKLLDYALGVSKKLGFDGIEMWGREPHVSERFDETRMRASRRLLDSRGVTPYVLGSYLRFGRTRNETDVNLSDTLHVARWLKTNLVRVWASDVGSAQATEEVWRNAVSEAREACDRAAKLNTTLVVEMHAGTLADTGPSTVQLVEAVGRDNFKVNFQIASHKDGQSCEERLAMVMPWVAHVHAQNYVEIPQHPSDPLRRVPLATGVANYPILIGMLKEAGYQGAIALEFPYDNCEDRAAALGEDLQFLRSICG